MTAKWARILPKEETFNGISPYQPLPTYPITETTFLPLYDSGVARFGSLSGRMLIRFSMPNFISNQIEEFYANQNRVESIK